MPTLALRPCGGDAIPKTAMGIVTLAVQRPLPFSMRTDAPESRTSLLSLAKYVRPNSSTITWKIEPPSGFTSNSKLFELPMEFLRSLHSYLGSKKPVIET